MDVSDENSETALAGARRLDDSIKRVLQRVFVPEIMSIEAASGVLHCSVDTVRRIPGDELPAYRVGKNNLYLRDDVLRYVRSRRIAKGAGENRPNPARNDVAALIQEVLNSSPVDAREPSIRRVK